MDDVTRHLSPPDHKKLLGHAYPQVSHTASGRVRLTCSCGEKWLMTQWDYNRLVDGEEVEEDLHE